MRCQQARLEPPLQSRALFPGWKKEHCKKRSAAAKTNTHIRHSPREDTWQTRLII